MVKKSSYTEAQQDCLFGFAIQQRIGKHLDGQFPATPLLSTTDYTDFTDGIHCSQVIAQIAVEPSPTSRKTESVRISEIRGQKEQLYRSQTGLPIWLQYATANWKAS